MHVHCMDIDNRWLIPYNSCLLTVFHCQSNVEICSTIKAVAYLYKYAYKGPDNFSFGLSSAGNHENNDGIDNYQSTNWLSSLKVVRRIYGFDLYNMPPSVMLLRMHMPHMQSM